MSHRKKFFLFAILSLAFCTPAGAGDLPRRVGQCVRARIKSVETRLEGTPGSGSAVSFENGGDQVSYDTVPAIEHSKAGDPVRMCLVSIPRNCPKGDDRGRVYRTTNLRTHQTWKLPDSEHMCGGA
ncbi:MAG: hypothetical protein WBW81_06400 [Methylocella sp.]